MELPLQLFKDLATSKRTVLFQAFFLSSRGALRVLSSAHPLKLALDRTSRTRLGAIFRSKSLPVSYTFKKYLVYIYIRLIVHIY